MSMLKFAEVHFKKQFFFMNQVIDDFLLISIKIFFESVSDSKEKHAKIVF